MLRSAFFVFLLSVPLLACAGPRSEPAAQAGQGPETLTVSVGPCFGFCPVFTAEFRSDGHVLFEGLRHTAELGQHERRITPAMFRMIATELRPGRFGSGGPDEHCDTQLSDQSEIAVTWSSPSGGTARTVHSRGCRSAPGAAFEAAVAHVLNRTGIDQLARQVTRPGTPRG